METVAFFLLKGFLNLRLPFQVSLTFVRVTNRWVGGLLSHCPGVRIIDHCVTNNETDRTHMYHTPALTQRLIAQSQLNEWKEMTQFSLAAVLLS